MRLNLKKYLKMANKANIAVALSIVVTTTSISFVTFAKNTTTPIQYSVYDIIGDASQYGIICDKLTVNADLESNFAANSVIFAGQADSGNSAGKFTNVGGTIYMKELTLGTIQLYPTNNLVVGTKYFIDNNILTFENGSKILLANSSNVNIALDPDYMDINESIDDITNSVNKYTATATTIDAIINLKDMNNAIIDITNCSNNICTVYVPLSEYKTIQPGGLKIFKNDSQALIIKLINDGSTTLVNDNVTNLVTENVYINRYFINNENSAIDNALNSETIIWNLTDFDDTIITISEGCGIFVAPNANVALGGCGRGHIISKFFTTSGNEWHFLSDSLSEETTNNVEVSSEVISSEAINSSSEITFEDTLESSSEIISSEEVASTTEITSEVTEEYSSEIISSEEVTSTTEITSENTEEYSSEIISSEEVTSTTEITPDYTEESSTKAPEITSAPYEETNTSSEEETTKKPSGILGTETVRETTTATTIDDEVTTTAPHKKSEVLGTEIINEKESATKKSEVLSSEEINTGDKNNFLLLGVIAVSSFTTIVIGILDALKRKKH